MPLNLWRARKYAWSAGKRYFCRRFSISESSGSRGPVETGRARFSDRSIAERVLKWFDTAGRQPRYPTVPTSAAADLPGLRPFRRGCRRLAQEPSYAACSCWKTVCISCELRLLHADLAELRHIGYIYDEFRMRQRVSGGKSGADRPQNAYIYTHVSGHWQRRRAVRNVQAGWRAGWAGWAGGRAAWLTGGRR